MSPASGVTELQSRKLVKSQENLGGGMVENTATTRKIFMSIIFHFFIVLLHISIDIIINYYSDHKSD